MIERKKKKCKCGCGKEGYIWAKGMMKECYYKNKPLKMIKRTPIKVNFEVTGQAILFETLMATRPNVSFITGKPINNISYSNCAHVLSKAQNKYPDFKLYDKNIVFLDNAYPRLEHHLFDNGTEKQREDYAKMMWEEYNIFVDWDKLYWLMNELKDEYFKQQKLK